MKVMFTMKEKSGVLCFALEYFPFGMSGHRNT